MDELRRRKVFRAAAAYVVVGLSLLGAAELVLDPLGLGEARSILVILVVFGFPIALVLAWAYELRPEEASGAGVLAARSVPGDRISIVVLPFANLSPNGEDAYFSEGLTDEIITTLAYLRSLRIISRSTAMVLKDTGKDVRTIGRELGVQYVLEGSVRKAGDQVRVTAQLIDAETDEHLWSERHHVTLGAVFEVQERIAKHVAEALRLRLSPVEERRLSDRAVDDPKAFDTWILAMYEGRKFTAAGIERGIQLAEEAVAAAGDNAHLYASLGYLHWAAYDFGVRYEDATLDRAEDYARRALDQDPTLPLALHARGLVQYKRGDIAAFVRYTRAAVDLGGASDAAGMLAFVLAEVGRIDEARYHGEEAIRADPLTFFPWFSRASADLFDGRCDAAFNRIRDARDRLARHEPFAGWWVAQMAAYAGDYDVAHHEAAAITSMDGGLWTDFCRLLKLALEGKREELVDLVDASRISRVGMTDEYYPVFIANCLTRVGESERAISWLEQAVAWGFTNHGFLGESNRMLEPLHGDPRFIRVLERAREKLGAFPP